MIARQLANRENILTQLAWAGQCSENSAVMETEFYYHLFIIRPYQPLEYVIMCQEIYTIAAGSTVLT
jgi:hypothetical protein